LVQKAEEDFDQTFQYHHYGVFSPTLAADIEYAQQFSLVSECADEEQRYTIKLDRWNAKSQRIPFPSEIHELIIDLSQREPMLLEALSTVVYLSNNRYSGENLKVKLSELKPNLKKYFRRAFVLARKYYQIDV
jgi:hypothetical protein